MQLPIAGYDVAWQRNLDDDGNSTTRATLDLHVKTGVPNTVITTVDHKTVVDVQITFADPSDPTQIGFVHDHGARATMYVTIPPAESASILEILHAKPVTIICGLWDQTVNLGYFHLLTSDFDPVIS
ncbi:MAG: hypothetical protein JO016_17100 [Actinobacteria bacterium]|nr:hypothetical protein [Actinomycetota bacterium]